MSTKTPEKTSLSAATKGFEHLHPNYFRFWENSCNINESAAEATAKSNNLEGGKDGFERIGPGTALEVPGPNGDYGPGWKSPSCLGPGVRSTFQKK